LRDVWEGKGSNEKSVDWLGGKGILGYDGYMGGTLYWFCMFEDASRSMAVLVALASENIVHSRQLVAPKKREKPYEIISFDNPNFGYSRRKKDVERSTHLLANHQSSGKLSRFVLLNKTFLLFIDSICDRSLEMGTQQRVRL